MIVNQHALLKAVPIKDMLTEKQRNHGVSHGLSEAGYDIRIKQDVVFSPAPGSNDMHVTVSDDEGFKTRIGRFTIASAIEEFEMPDFLVGVVHDKSTWARRGLSVFNTVIEPGWNGFLTLELVYHGYDELHIPAGAGIAQVLFSRIDSVAAYDGKYQNQEDRPVDAVFEADLV